MLIKNVSLEGNSGFRLQAISEGEELVPKLDSLIFDATPTGLSPIKILIAGALIFGDTGLERIEPHGDVPSNLVKQVQALVSVGKEPVVEVDSLLNGGVDETETRIRATTLEINLSTVFAHNTPEIDRTTLSLIPGDRYSGVLWGIKEAVVASNSWLHEKYTSRSKVAAAVGVLFADEFLAKSICIPKPSKNDAQLIRNLCKLAGIEVEFKAE